MLLCFSLDVYDSIILLFERTLKNRHSTGGASGSSLADAATTAAALKYHLHLDNSPNSLLI